MRTLSLLVISLLLVSAEQLRAQTNDPLETVNPPRDPFGPLENAPPRVESNDRLSVSRQKSENAAHPEERTVVQPVAPFPPVRAGRAAASHERIEKALNRETAFDYLDQPLEEVIEDIAFNHEIPIILDARALEDFGIDSGTPISKSLRGLSLRSALRLVLRELDLTFVIRDEVLQVTTPEAAEFAPSTRFYHVAELLPPHGDGEVLVELIKTLVASDTWCGSDHVGAITYVEHLESLAIRQTDEVFHEIEELLATTKQIVENQRSQGRPHERDPFE